MRFGRFRDGVPLPAADADAALLNIHHSRASDLVRPDLLVLDHRYRLPPTATFGNWCSRIVATERPAHAAPDALVNDSGLPIP